MGSVSAASAGQDYRTVHRDKQAPCTWEACRDRGRTHSHTCRQQAVAHLAWYKNLAILEPYVKHTALYSSSSAVRNQEAAIEPLHVERLGRLLPEVKHRSLAVIHIPHALHLRGRKLLQRTYTISARLHSLRPARSNALRRARGTPGTEQSGQ